MRRQSAGRARAPGLVVLAFLAIALVYLLALRLDPPDVDAAEYALIARQMLASRSFLVVHCRGWDYLDKPPLTFWLTALSYAVFGISNAASKVPSLLAALVGWLSVGKLASLDSGRRTGALAALLFASCQALFLITNDCRTDTVLLGAVAFSLWQARAYGKSGSARALLLTGLGTGLALLAKGPIGAVVPAFAVGSEIALRREWKRFLSPAPLAVGVIASVLLIPMLVGLHREFGIHGIAFFFWTQSFGRITGSNAWHNHTDPLFFAHTLLWAFLPWSPMFVAALFAEARSLVKRRLRGEPGEGFAAGGFALTFVALSLSHYKLPHYIFVALPFVAVLTARWLDRFLDAGSRRARTVLLIAQMLVIGALGGLAVWLTVRVFPLRHVVVGAAATALFLAAMAAAWLARDARARLVAPSLLAILGANVVLAGHFYPRLLRYQSGSTAVRAARAEAIPLSQVACFRKHPYSLDVALERVPVEIHQLADLVRRVNATPMWLYTDPKGLTDVEQLPVTVGREIALADYPVTKLTTRFLDPATRPEVLTTAYLVHLTPAKDSTATARHGVRPRSP